MNSNYDSGFDDQFDDGICNIAHRNTSSIRPFSNPSSVSEMRQHTFYSQQGDNSIDDRFSYIRLKNTPHNNYNVPGVFNGKSYGSFHTPGESFRSIDYWRA